METQSSDGLDLAQLMDQIRKDAEKRKRNSLKNGVSPFYRQLMSQGFDGLLSQRNSPLPDLKLQPPLEKPTSFV